MTLLGEIRAPVSEIASMQFFLIDSDSLKSVKPLFDNQFCSRPGVE